MSPPIISSKVSDVESTTSLRNYDTSVTLRDVRRTTYKNLVVVATGFLFLFIAFQGLQNLQTSIHSDAKLGLASLCVIYASLVLSCMFVPPLLINRLGPKYTIILSMSGYVVYSLSMFYPHYGTLIPASILVGFCAAPLWSSKCAYVTTMSIKLGKTSGVSSDIIITKLFGVFFLLFQTAQIWGNLISSQVLKPQGGGNSSIDFDVSANCGVNYCPSTKILTNQIAEKSTVNLLMGIYLGCGFLAMLTIFIFLDKMEIEGENSSEGTCSLFISTLTFLGNRKMQLLVPITIFSGLEQGFVYADFSKAFVTCSIGIDKVGLVMIFFGIVDAFFSLFLGKIVEWTGRPVMIGVGVVVNMSLLILFIVWTPDKETVYVFYLGAALWGFSDAVWQTQINAFYGVLFPTQQEAAFSNYRLWESLGFVLSFAYGDYLCVDVKLYILMVVLVVGVALYAVIEVIRKKEDSQPKAVDIGEGSEIKEGNELKSM